MSFRIVFGAPSLRKAMPAGSNVRFGMASNRNSDVCPAKQLAVSWLRARCAALAFRVLFYLVIAVGLSQNTCNVNSCFELT